MAGDTPVTTPKLCAHVWDDGYVSVCLNCGVERAPSDHPSGQSLSQLALDLWAEIDTKISPPGVLDHTQAVPIMRQWLLDHQREIANAR